MIGIPMRVTLALASVGSGVVHFLVTPEHFEEFALFGAFFLALAVFQTVWAGAVLLKPNGMVLLVGIVASAAVVALWALSRTVGLPVGPEAGEAEAVGTMDVLATGLEALIVVVGTVALTRQGRSARETEVPVEEETARAA